MCVASDIWLKKGVFRLLLLMALQLVMGSSMAQTNPDYLKSLEGEAENLTLDKETELKSTQSKISNSVAGTEESPGSLTNGLTVEQFEMVLQKNYIGSYLFYKRLSNSQKKEVYAYYQNNPNPDLVRDKILQVSKK